MSESTLNLINAIQAGDATAVEASFQAAMAEKIAPRLDAMRQDVAANMFKAAEAAPAETVTATE